VLRKEKKWSTSYRAPYYKLNGATSIMATVWKSCLFSKVIVLMCFLPIPPSICKKNYGAQVNDGLGDAEYIEWCYRWIDEGIRLLKPGGAFYLYNLPKWNVHLSSYLAQRLTFRHWIAVDIKFSLPIQGRLYPSHYSLLYFIKGTKPNTFNPPRLPLETCRHCGGEIKDYGGYKSKMNPRGVNLSDVWTDIPPVRHSKYKTRRANELGLKMMDRVLDISSREDDIVFDPFGGSGTTYVAAELKGRRWLGVEVSTCQDIVQRFSTIRYDGDHLAGIRKKLNVLFTEEALEIRRKKGHDNGKYRLNEYEVSEEENVQLRLMLERGRQYLCECEVSLPESRPVQSQQ